MRNFWRSFSFCFWNLHLVMANNFCKISLLEAYNSQYNFDIICLGETYLNSSYRSDEPALNINEYNLIRSDHPSDTKRGGVAIYYKNYLPLRICDVSFFDECLLVEINFDKKKVLLNFIISVTKSIIR